MLTNTNKMYSESTDLRQGVQPQPELIRNSNPNFWIHPGSDLDVCRIAPKMLRIHYLVSDSHFGKMTKLNGGLSQLHSADKDVVLWLTSYG